MKKNEKIEKIEKIIPKELLFGEDGSFQAIILTNGQKIPYSHWEYFFLKEFRDVVFEIPSKKEKHVKLVNPGWHVDTEGIIKKTSPYWRKGIKVGDKIVTRAFYHYSQEKNIIVLPFGQTVEGLVQFWLAKNKKTSEERLIINYHVCRDKVKKGKIKIDFEKTDRKVLWSCQVPQTDKSVYVRF